MKEKNKDEKKNNKAESEISTTKAAPDAPEKKRTTKTVVVKSIKQGAGVISRSGDFIGRLGTLLVMIVTSINTGTVMVTSFIEGVYWKGGVHAFLLAFIHLPVIIVMVWLMCKARVQSIYRKIRPSKPGEKIDVTDVENDTVIYEETVEVQETEDNNTDGQIVTEKVKDGKRKTETVKEKVTEKIKQQTTEEKLKDRLNNAEQINKAFEMSSTLG